MNPADRRDFEELEKRLADARVYFERVVADLEKNTSLALSEARRAIDKADAANDKRFDGINEFRSALADQAKDFMPREEYNARHEALVTATNLAESRVSSLEARLVGRLSTLEGRITGYASVAIITALIISVLSHFIK